MNKKKKIAILGAPSSSSKLSLLLRQGDYDIHKLVYSPQLDMKLTSEYWDAIIITSSKRNVASACKAIQLVTKKLPSTPKILYSAIKDPELMCQALTCGMNKLLLDSGKDEELYLQLKKLLFTITTKGSTSGRKILAIGAHPDDVEIGCGGTLMKHFETNDRVTILTLTGGACGGEISERLLESQRAAKYLNADLVMGELEDTRLSEGPETISLIQKVVQSVQPDIIYTHSVNDTHQDHRATYYATLVAARTVEKIYAYLAPSGTTEFHPRYFEHVECFMENKIQAINCFTSQTITCGRKYLKDSIIRSTAEYWGRFSNYGMVEPFEVIRS